MRGGRYDFFQCLAQIVDEAYDRAEMTAEDFAMPHMEGGKTERKIGFGAA